MSNQRSFQVRQVQLAAALALTAITCVAACGGDAAPTTPSQQAPPTTSLRVTIDSLGSEVAVAALSDVRFEATSDNAVEVREVRIDFGDGSSATGSSARHIYAAAGTFTATAAFTLRSGQQVTVTRPVLVRAVEGLWHHAEYNAASRRVEIRRITLTQEGQTLRGTLSMSGEPDRPIAGTLSGERQARLVSDGQEFAGTIASSVTGENASWLLRLQGGTASDQTLTFRPAFGEPAAPPVANLQLIQPEGFIVEGLEIGFDASASSGQDLIYFIDYGDGHHTSETVSRHAPESSGHLTARLTVVDRFGRDAVAQPRLDVEDLEQFDGTARRCLVWIHRFTNPVNGQDEFRRLFIKSHKGRQVDGAYSHPDLSLSPFTGSLSGSHDINFVLTGGGIDFRGTVAGGRRIGGTQVFHMPLTLRGGSADGLLLLFDESIYPCS